MKRILSFGEELQLEMENAEAFTSIVRGDDGEESNAENDGDGKKKLRTKMLPEIGWRSH